MRKAFSFLSNKPEDLRKEISPFLTACVSLVGNGASSKQKQGKFFQYADNGHHENEAMSNFAKNRTSTVIPSMVYRDAVKAIEWLCRAFGFRKHTVYPNSDGTIGHAELTFGNGMIMLGSARPGETSLEKHLDTTGADNSRSVNLIAENPDAIYALAKANGAEIVSEIEDKDYGGRGFACRDLEGYLWHIGSYNPWQKPSK